MFVCGQAPCSRSVVLLLTVSMPCKYDLCTIDGVSDPVSFVVYNRVVVLLDY